MSGYIKIHRNITKNNFWRKGKFSYGQAWVDLLLEAAWKDHKVLCGQKLISVERGQIIYSMRALAKRWSWGIGKTYRFIERLKAEGLAEHKTEHKTEQTKEPSITSLSSSSINIKTRGGIKGGGLPEENEDGENHTLHSEIVLRWNTLASEFGLIVCKKLSPKRRQGINARQRDGMLDVLDQIFKQIETSDFLQGATGRDSWRGCSFDWLFCSPNNWVKAFEGKYANGTGKNQQHRTGFKPGSTLDRGNKQFEDL